MEISEGISVGVVIGASVGAGVSLGVTSGVSVGSGVVSSASLCTVVSLSEFTGNGLVSVEAAYAPAGGSG